MKRCFDRRHSRAQSLVELALVLPVILLFLLAAIDFGRVYLGWVNLNQMARLAANYASTNPDADFASPTGRYQTIVLNDAKAINCDLLPVGSAATAPAPTFGGSDLGDAATVAITCSFELFTPIISSIMGSAIDVTAAATFPIRTGAVNGIPTGGGGTSNVPIADFSATPLSGLVGGSGLLVTFSDLSSNAPITWQWNFGDASGSNLQNPTHTYTAAGTYTVTLVATNPAGNDTETKSGYIVVTDNPTGLTADFSANPTSGVRPQLVAFTDLSTGAVTTWAWTFGDGGTSNVENPSHTYNAVGVYDVTLTVGDGTTTNAQTKTGYITIAQAMCTVPNVSDGSTRKNQATNLLQGQGFVVSQVGGNGNWIVRVQSPQGGLSVPCGSTVQIFQ